MKTTKTNKMNLQIVRNVAYSQINKINKNIKEIIEVDNTLLKMIDINMKNAINKIINDYKAYEETGIIKVK
jgi:basic membrane lipoprotein Med (substrate-binding protein (PBP1-ABC) superfamily)